MTRACRKCRLGGKTICNIIAAVVATNDKIDPTKVGIATAFSIGIDSSMMGQSVGALLLSCRRSLGGFRNFRCGLAMVRAINDRAASGIGFRFCKSIER